MSIGTTEYVNAVCDANRLSSNGCQIPCHVVFHSKEFAANLRYSSFCALKS